MAMLRLVSSSFMNQFKPSSFTKACKNERRNIYFPNVRYLETLSITKSLELYTKDIKEINKPTMKLTELVTRPLVILLPWLKAKPEHLMKFVEFYMDYGFDVLTATITTWQFLWPQMGSQLVADDMLKFLYVNQRYYPLFLHGFSAGSYLWGEVLKKISEEEDRYDPILKRIAGQVWDCCVPMKEACSGLAASVFPKSSMLQNSLKPFINMHMKVFEDSATCHYLKSSDMFHTKVIEAPAQLFVSKSDKIGLETANKKLGEYWAKKGIKVYWKCWDDSPHIQNFRYHPTEYLEELTKFLVKINLVSSTK